MPSTPARILDADDRREFLLIDRHALEQLIAIAEQAERPVVASIALARAAIAVRRPPVTLFGSVCGTCRTSTVGSTSCRVCGRRDHSNPFYVPATPDWLDPGNPLGEGEGIGDASEGD